MKLSYIITFAAGALLGAVPTYFITRNIERKRADEEIQAYKDHVDKRISDLEERLGSQEKIVLSESEEKSIEELSKNVDNAVEEYNKTKERIKWQGQMTPDEARETGDPELIEAAEWLDKRNKMLAEGKIKGQDGSPQVISMLTYTGEGEGEYTYQDDYDHVSLDWYAGDCVLAYANLCEVDGVEHEMGEIVDKPNFVVGWKWKEHFGDPELFNDEDCVYVRNEFLKCDFEIIRDAGSYREIVLGDYSEEENGSDKS
jgi:uncharacterized coiled-coil protein SlyX